MPVADLAGVSALAARFGYHSSNRDHSSNRTVIGREPTN